MIRTRLSLLLAAMVGALALGGPAHAAAPGVNISNYGDAQTALDMGARQVRFFVRWNDFEPTGPRDFSAKAGAASPNIFTRGLEANVQRVLAAGATPTLVVLGAPPWASSGARPRSADEYGAFFGELVGWLAAQRKPGQPSTVFEVWNEADSDAFWGETPDPTFYTEMLRVSYAAGKQADPSATILVGPTTGNNFAWIEALYARGAKGSFDGVAVHTDTACSVVGPDTFYRGPDGRLGQFTFLGYREVRASMLANGDDKPIYMTELGWSSTNGGPTSCARGTYAGQKPSGVSEATQADYLSHAFRCLAHDPYVVAATVFTLRDDAGQPVSSELGHYGLLRRDGSAKPALAAFATAGQQVAGACGDFEPPALDVLAPVEGQKFIDKLDLKALARDGGVGLSRVTYSFNGGQNIRSFSAEDSNVGPVGLAPWYNSSQLALGAHTIEVTALDRNGNTVRKSVRVEKVLPGALVSSLTPRFKVPTKVTCRKARRGGLAVANCSYRGVLSRGMPGRPSIGGRVSVEWQFKNKKRQWRKLSGGLARAHKPFVFRAAPRRKGAWRVRVVYVGQAPYKRTASPWVAFRLK